MRGKVLGENVQLGLRWVGKGREQRRHRERSKEGPRGKCSARTPLVGKGKGRSRKQGRHRESEGPRGKCLASLLWVGKGRERARKDRKKEGPKCLAGFASQIGDAASVGLAAVTPTRNEAREEI